MQQPPTKVAQWIASIYDERDQALAGNRELEEHLAIANEVVYQLKVRNAELEKCISEAIALAEEK